MVFLRGVFFNDPLFGRVSEEGVVGVRVSVCVSFCFLVYCVLFFVWVFS